MFFIGKGMEWGYGSNDGSRILYLGCQHYNRLIIYKKKFVLGCQYYKFFFKKKVKKMTYKGLFLGVG